VRRYAAPSVVDVADLRRVAGWALVAGLCVSAAAALCLLVAALWVEDADGLWRAFGRGNGGGA
jgi:hypothetical protein